MQARIPNPARYEATMATQHAIDEAQIRQRIGKLTEALRAMDLERVMSIYAPDIVSFDIVPPLQHVGAEAKKNNWTNAFAMFQRPLGYEIRNLTITMGDDVAFGHSLNRINGTLKNGTSTDIWLRWTACLRKIDGNWLIVHDQVSVPLDFESGRALLNLAP
jgi:ketosteroid isomerase-like protein